MSDDHWSRIDGRAFEAVRAVIEALEEARIPYVLVGGWAVFAYGSTVPSVDTDVFVPKSKAQEAVKALTDRGLAPRRGSRVELLDLDGENRILGPDPEMGDRDVGYVPGELFTDATTTRELPLPSGPLAATVPLAPQLCLTKLKAFHDRRLAWQAMRDPGIMARLHPTDRTMVRELTQEYYLRKAGKDLYDIAFLEAHHGTLAAAMALRDRFGLGEWVLPEGLVAEWQLMDFALGLAREDTAMAAVIQGALQPA